MNNNESDFQTNIKNNMELNDYKGVYSTIESDVDDTVIAELEQLNDPKFTNAVENALQTTSNNEQIFQGQTTAVLVNIEGDIKAFFTNDNESEYQKTFIKAALQKATARARLEQEKLKGGLVKNEDHLKEQGYNRHEGAAIPSVNIDGVEYFIGVSGAAVNSDFNRKAMQTEERFNKTGEIPEWRAAGFWDFMCATLIRNNLMGNAKKDIGPIIVTEKNAENPFFD